MPKTWYDWAANEELPEAEREFNRRILADKKPYFMRYIYPKLMRDYKKYVADVHKKCFIVFGISLNELLESDRLELTEEQREFVDTYRRYLQVGTHDCVLNRICRRFEDRFDAFLKTRRKSVSFDYAILKSGATYRYSQLKAMRDIYRDYIELVKDYMVRSKLNRPDQDEYSSTRQVMLQEYREKCLSICSEGAKLCDIMLDMCYKASTSKQLVWDICKSELIDNLLHRCGNKINVPIKDADGDITYCGERFSILTITLEDETA